MKPPPTDPTFQPEPEGIGGSVTESLNCIDAYDEGPGDLTVRPVPDNIPLGWWPRPEFPGKAGDSRSSASGIGPETSDPPRSKSGG
jgi:hypothetical protein